MAESGSFAARIRSGWERRFSNPDIATPAERRLYKYVPIVIPPVLLMHFLYIFLFAYWGVWPLAIFNIFSVLIWTAALYFLPQRRFNTVIQAAVEFEVITHSTLVIIFIGWGFGAQYFIFFLFAGTIIISWRPRWFNITLTVFYTLVFIVFYYYTEFFSPLYAVPALQLAVINVLNISAMFFLIGVATIYLVSEADRLDKLNEDLLNNVLPKPIATRLKQDKSTIADGFKSASILFADLAGFTPVSAELTPNQLVELLDTIFSRFNDLVDRFGLEKIKTIGDEYMVASGIPIARDDHAEALARFSLAMRDSLEEYNQATGIDLQLRIGLNSGPVVAGAIGKRRFLYDLWGDSVNTASRMESHRIPGEIQVTEATRQLLKDQFTFVDRGLVEIKGKGPMQTYFLQGNGQGQVRD